MPTLFYSVWKSLKKSHSENIASEASNITYEIFEFSRQNSKTLSADGFFSKYVRFFIFMTKIGFLPQCVISELLYLHFGGGTRRSILSLFVCGQHLMIVVRNSMSAWSISLDSRTLIFRFSRINANRVVVKCTYKKPKSTLVKS